MLGRQMGELVSDGAVAVGRQMGELVGDGEVAGRAPNGKAGW